MKRIIIIVGMIGAIFIALGVLFKLFHWPGANMSIVVGSTALFLYSFVFMYERLQTTEIGIGKVFVILFGLTGASLSIAFMFKMLHWPGSDILIYCFFAIYFVLLFVSLYRAVVEKDKELQFMYFNYFIWLMGGILILAFPTIIRFLR